MDIGSVLLIFALAILAAFFVRQPFNHPVSGRARLFAEESENNLLPDELENRRFALLAERDRLLNLLSEIDSDYSLGKVPQEDHLLQRASLLEAGACVLRHLDELKLAAEPLNAIKQDRGEKANISVGLSFCPHCVSILQPEDVFCTRCGHKIAKS